jgi:hypothetical protein
VQVRDIIILRKSLQYSKKNDYQLRSIGSFVQKDYSSKEAFYDYYTKQASDKNQFMIHDLKSRLKDLKHKKDAILARSQYIKSINGDNVRKPLAFLKEYGERRIDAMDFGITGL